MLNGFYESTDGYGRISVKSNYHTHNYLCGHAGGTVCDYVKKAVEFGLETLGVSDHCASPLGTVEPYITPKTMDRLYLPQFDEARKIYGERIRILSAVEIEYFSGHDEYYSELLKKLDYLVLGQHEYILKGARRNSFCDGLSEADVVAYFYCAIEGLRSGKFALFAHPDLIFYRKPKITLGMAEAFDRAIRAAVENNVAVELNANGIRNHGFRYPTDMLIELCKKYDAKVVVSSDCHSPDEFIDENLLRLYAYAQNNKLNITDELNLKN